MPILMGGCSMITDGWIKPQDAGSTPASDTAATPPATQAATAQYQDRIPRLTERPGIEPAKLAHDATDVWDRIRMQLALGGADRPEVQHEIDWFAHNTDFVERTAERAKPYLYYIVDEIEKRQMPLELALLPIVESAYRPDALSPSRAVGIWQFIPSTGTRFGLKRSRYYDGRRDVMASTGAALDYLQKLHDEFNGDWLEAIAAYNCGEKTVERAIDANRSHGKPTDFWSLDLPRETTRYVPRLLAIAQVVTTPLRYGIALAPVPNKPYLATVKVATQVDLDKAAKLAGVTTHEMRNLNPGFLKKVTDPAGPHRLVLPVAQADAFRAALAEAGPGSIKATTTLHAVQSGESLWTIARHYRVEVAEIKLANHLSRSLLHIGQELVIPVAGAVAASTPPPAAQMVSTGAVERRGDDKIVHVVHSGESLWTIARSYKVSVNKLLAWNGLRRNTVLNLDQQIVIWKHHDNSPKIIKTALSSDDVGDSRLIKYAVKNGDSLWTIARHFDVSVDQLCEWNRMNRHELLQPGNEIDVYVSQADSSEDGVRI